VRVRSAQLPKPAQPIEKSTASASLLAEVIVAKVADHLPVHRHTKMFRRFGVELSDQTYCGWLRQSAEPLYQSMKAFVLSSKVVGTDDTPVKVLDPTLPHARTRKILAVRRRPGACGRGLQITRPRGPDGSGFVTGWLLGK
jgi:hypothetical protein